jgi:hypothetical protein
MSQTKPCECLKKAIHEFLNKKTCSEANIQVTTEGSFEAGGKYKKIYCTIHDKNSSFLVRDEK